MHIHKPAQSCRDTNNIDIHVDMDTHRHTQITQCRTPRRTHQHSPPSVGQGPRGPVRTQQLHYDQSTLARTPLRGRADHPEPSLNPTPRGLERKERGWGWAGWAGNPEDVHRCSFSASCPPAAPCRVTLGPRTTPLLKARWRGVRQRGQASELCLGGWGHRQVTK